MIRVYLLEYFKFILFTLMFLVAGISVLSLSKNKSPYILPASIVIGIFCVSTIYLLELMAGINPNAFSLLTPFALLIIFRFKNVKEQLSGMLSLNGKKVSVAIPTLILSVLVFLPLSALPLSSWDSVSMWAYKADYIYTKGELPLGSKDEALKILKTAPTIAENLNEGLEFTFRHPDYPPMVPLAYASIYGIVGEIDHNTIKYLNLIFMLSGIGFISIFLRRVGASLFVIFLASALIAFAPNFLGYLSTVKYFALADYPLAIASLGLLVLLIDCIVTNKRIPPLYFIAMISSVSMIKNEGIAILVSFFIGSMLLGFRRYSDKQALYLFISLIPFLLWRIYLVANGISSEFLKKESVMGLLDNSIERVHTITGSIYSTALGDNSIFYVLLLIPFIAIISLAVRDRVSGFIALVSCTYLAINLGIYSISPYPLDWHISLSFDRIITPISGFMILALSYLASTLGSPKWNIKK